ncbi:MAG: hypothetical protein IKM00_05405 [Clostridia bacterium]|nr:hypothetical protein [Clostridia bacterium]
MTGRERFCKLIRKEKADHIGFWMGDPISETRKIYMQKTGVKKNGELSVYMRDDFRWIAPDYKCWVGKNPMFDVLNGETRISLSQPGMFADCEDPAEIEAYDNMPDPEYIDLDRLEALLDEAHANGMATASGMWSCFFHVVADFFGMENYFMKMYTDPEVVEALTERVVDFYLAANERIFRRLGNKIDVFFMGNDLGTQRDLLISPECYRRFVKPYQKKLIDQAKSFSLPVMVHSCGAIGRIIPDLLELGIDALHPLQAQASGMDAKSLSQYKGKLLFVGGVDTQQLLPNADPDTVKEAVMRLYENFGDFWIASPSHEGVLPNIPLENILAIRETAEQLGKEKKI